MASKSVLIVGGNRGIGLNLLKAFVAESWNVTGTVRPQTRRDDDPSIADLEKTGARILEIDYLDESTIEKAAIAYGNKPLDLLINTNDMLVEKYRVMAVGPLLTIKHFLPKLEQAPGAKIVNISSAFGSISTNSFGTFMAYRIAKAALNQGAVTMGREWDKEGRKVTMICVEPGFLSTRLTGWDGVDNMDKGMNSRSSRLERGSRLVSISVSAPWLDG
ncbi:NAD(P)-binding protein [Dichotomopilus funicola]|uniref:NAD(P)-binding protein n=1 Tax=Dichotomopilus funicola TaxID=1934379 RepID=A0AAN6UZK7_9PEZI|nr:NAD(P)-binding protein [Dichotomopilus funicola]